MKQFAVIGLGRFGSSVARALYDAGHDVLAIDNSMERVENISPYVTHAMQADATDEDALKAMGIRNFDVVIVSIGSDIQASILVTVLCKEAGVNYVVAKANDELHAKVLYKIGADKVVSPERDMGIRVAHNLISANTLDYIEVSPDCNLVEISPLAEWDGKSLRDINMRAKYGINIVAVKRHERLDVSPDAEYVVQKGDILVAIGSTNDIRRIEEKH
jgi:trk system potassium uptake protein TrkA